MILDKVTSLSLNPIICKMGRKELRLHIKITACNFIHIYIYIYCFLGLRLWHMEVPRLGIKLELQLLAHGNAGSLTHWERPGIESASLWIPVGFITTEPWWEFWETYLFNRLRFSELFWGNYCLWTIVFYLHYNFISLWVNKHRTGFHGWRGGEERITERNKSKSERNKR